MDNKIEDFFQESEGVRTDNNNLTITGSGESFDFGSDFVPLPTITERDRSDSPVFGNDFDIPDFDIREPKFDNLEIENPVFQSTFAEDEPLQDIRADLDVKDFFQESEGAGIDDDNLTIVGSGEGFDFGSNFVPPPVIERERDRSPLSDNDDFDIPDSDEPDFEFTPSENPFSSLFGEDAPFPNLRTAIDGNGLIFDSEYYVEQNPELDISPADALSHFEDNVHSNNGGKADTEYRFLLKEDGTLPPYLSAVELEYGLPNQLLPEERLVLYFDREYYLEQNPDLNTKNRNAFDITTTSHFSEHGILENREHRYALIGNLLLFENAAEDSEDSLSGAGANITGIDNLLLFENAAEDSEDSLSGAGANITGGEQNFDLSTVTESESEPVLDPDIKAARIDFFQDYITSGIEGSIADADLGLGTTSYISSDEIALEPSNDSFI